MSDVVDAVQVAPARFVEHVLTFGPHHLDGVVAEEDLTGRPADDKNFNQSHK